MEDQLSRAKSLIQQKQYDQARAILAGMDHPTARNWLAKIDEMDNPFDVTPSGVRSTPSISSQSRKRMRGFKTRQRIFWVLTFLAFGWMCFGAVATSSAVNDVTQNSTTQTEDEQAAYALGASIGGGLGLIVFICTGGPLFLIFALMAWRNGVGYRAEEHILETVSRE